MDKLEKNFCDKLTVEILKWLPPMRVIEFKSGKECITDWSQDKSINSNLSYRPKVKRYIFYYSEK